MPQVHTDLGPGEVVATETVRGRTSYRVAGRGFDKWFDETKVEKLADAYAVPSANPGDNHPDDPMGPFSHLGDEDPNAYNDPYHEEAYDYSEGGGQPHRHEEYWTPDEMSGLKDRAQGGPPPQHQFADPEHFPFDPSAVGPPGPTSDPWGDPRQGYRQAWAPVDHDNSVALPYDPTPQYPAIPGDTESTLQPIHGIDADERLSPADSITFDGRDDDESELEPTGPNFADRSAAFGGYPSHHGTEADYEDAYPPGHEFHDDSADSYGGVPYDSPEIQAHPTYRGGGDYHPSDAYGDLSKPYPEDTDYDSMNRWGSVHNAFAFLIPLAEGLMGAGAAGGAGAAAGGAAAEGGMASAMGGGLARGVGMGVGKDMMGGGEQGGQDPGMVDQAVGALSPGEGWGELQRGAALNAWLSGQESQEYTGTRQLSAKYIDIEASVDYHNDPVAQFRHDPIAYIQRTGHVYDEPTSPEMTHYGELVEANPTIREAAWKDVRAKAMRLRREGRVHVKDVDSDRIYASVDGDNGTYETMIVKGGAFGGFGGGHSITNWRCSCEWGRWAFKRQLTYVGRLCSHGYASYMELQSAHTKGQPRMQRQTRPYKKRADALQNIPQRLVPELVVNSEDDARQFLDVEKDEREDTGPGDVVQDEDIVHFARIMTACDQNQWPYPRELVSFLERLGEDQHTEDWKVEDTGKAGPALNEIRDWADTPQSEDWGHMDERNDDIRDAIETARENGVDASQLVAFRTAAPGDPKQPGSINDMMGVPAGGGTPVSGVDVRDPSTFPGVSGSPNTSAPGASTVSGQSDTTPNQDPRLDMMSAPYQQQAPAGAPASQQPQGNPQGIQGPGIAGNPGGPKIQGPGLNGDAPGGGAPKGPNTNASGGSSFYDNAYGADGSKATPEAGGNAIGQGQYNIQSGDTLSDIAQRSGYGGDYNELAQQNGIADPNKIDAGGKLTIGKPGGGNPDQAGVSKQEAPQATDNPATNAPGGPLNQNSGPPGADAGTGPLSAPASAASNLTNDLTNPGLTTPGAPASNPAQTGSNPATPSTGMGVGPVDVSAASGGGGDGGSGGAVSTNAVAAPPSMDSSSASGGAAAPTDTPQSGAADSVANASKSVISRSLFADQADYDDWHRFAYPDAKAHDHKPFAGSGPMPPLEIGTSEEYADKARKKADDVTDLDYDITKAVNPKQGSTGGGVRRAGSGPHRHVEPVVVREQRPTKGPHAPQTVEASMESFGNFNPLAARSPEDFNDDEAAVHMAASGNDIVAEFHRTGGAATVMSSIPSQSDNFDIAGAAGAFLQKTAGRNYSLAEQSELIREGDIGGAGNLGSLQLAGTHYEDESKHSVGLW